VVAEHTEFGKVKGSWMSRVVISGTGVFTPPQRIENEELVAAFNEYVGRQNRAWACEIEAGRREPLLPSSAEFILNASGIRSRYVMDRAGILDPEVMAPRLRPRAQEEPSLLCEMAEVAARVALPCCDPIRHGVAPIVDRILAGA